MSRDAFTGFATEGDRRSFYVEGKERCHWRLSTLDARQRRELTQAERVFAREGADACTAFLALPW